MQHFSQTHLDNLRRALAGGGTPRGDVAVVAAVLFLQIRTVAVLVSVRAGVGCKWDDTRNVLIYVNGGN